MAGPTVFEMLTALGTSQDAAAGAAASTLNQLAARHGTPTPAPYAGPGYEAARAATEAIAEAETAERELIWAQQLLPEAEERLAQLQRAARGRWILPLVLLVIVLAVLIGQLL